jgi:hypothetical protein
MAGYFGWGLCLFLGDVYGEFRADQLAQPAGYAITILLEPGRMISLGVEFVGQFKNPLGTELDAEFTAFASILDQVDQSFGTFMFCGIQRFTPEIPG